MTHYPPILAARRFSKAFAGITVLNEVDLQIFPGEVHALVGQNGSGKSTFIRILSGFHAPDRGAQLQLRGVPVGLPLRPDQPRTLGVSFLHQGLALSESMSILENLRINEFETGIGWHIRWRKERNAARRRLADYGLDRDPRIPVAALSQAERALIALIRALDHIRGVNQGLLVLDEPTAYLPRDAINRLFEAIRSVARNGSAVLLVTHRLEEVYEVCDRVCVLRDGRRVGTRDVSTTPERELISMILGRTLGDLHTTRTEQRRRDVVLRVEGLSGAFVSELTFELYEGEILGMTGLVGMGQDEVPYLLVGASRQRAGRVTMNGRVLVNSSPRHARQAGVVVLPANRAQDGGVPDLTVGENVSLPVLGSYYSRRWLHRAEERDAMRSLLKAFEVRPSEPERLLSTLSGGNQQKALVAKWLQLSPKVMILHEPTQGVDIGSRREIFGLLRKAAGRGSSIILVSSDHEELAHLCDRVLVFRHGRLSSVLTGGAVAADRIAERCYATGPAPQES